MGLNQEYKNGLIKQMDSAINGEVVKIPNALGERVGKVYNLLPSRYTLIAGATGSGKTAFTDNHFVLEPFRHLRTNDADVHWEVVYFSLERKQMFKHAKWIAWMIYMDTGVKISADQILGWSDKPLTEELYNAVRQYDPIINDLLNHVTIYDGKMSTKAIESIVRNKALQLGTFFFANEQGVFKQNDPVPIKTFDTDGVEVETPAGHVKEIELEFNGEKFTLRPHQHRYFLNNPKTFCFIIIDGIGLVGGSEFSKKKSSIDKVSEILAEARDQFGFSPVVVSQINRSLGDVQRQKLHGSDLSPQLEDVQGSSQTSHDADLVLALFDAYRYKAYNSQGEYGGYSVTQGMMAPSGFNRFRSLHILKNSFGYDGKVFGLTFIGENGHFMALPKPDSTEINEVYAKIAADTI